MNQKHRFSRKQFKNKGNIKNTGHKLDEVFIKFEKHKGGEAKQQEFKEDLNKLVLSLRFHDNAAVAFFDHLHPKFISLLRKGEYNYENVIEVKVFFPWSNIWCLEYFGDFCSFQRLK